LVNPKRVGETLHTRHVVALRDGTLSQIVRALREAATWAACSDVVVGRGTPPAATGLRAALIE
jgi:hypothetical protein